MTKIIFVFCIAQIVMAVFGTVDILFRFYKNEKNRKERKKRSDKRDKDEDELLRLQKEAAIAEKEYYQSMKQHDELWFIKRMNDEK